jgi:hypothetical protein
MHAGLKPAGMGSNSILKCKIMFITEHRVVVPPHPGQRHWFLGGGGGSLELEDHHTLQLFAPILESSVM